MVKIKNENELVENSELRTQLMERVEVLAKVKEIITLPNTELSTMKQVASYYEVNYDTIKKLVQRNTDELTNNGMKFMTYGELKDLLGGDKVSLAEISTKGSNIFSSRALLNVGMLLTESKIAKEVRIQLLNGFEQLSTEQKVKEINREDELMLAVMKASNPVEQMIAINEYNNYHNRHKAELNARIEEMKPKEDYYNALVDKNLLLNFRDTAKELKIGQKKFIEFLLEKKLIYRDSKNQIKPYTQYVPTLFELKEFANSKVAGNQTLITPEGRNKFKQLIEKEIQLTK